ncbi:sensor histidine kinase, partial [Streptomyces sp. NPDC087850]
MAVPVAFVSAVVSLAFQHTAAAVICGVVALPVLVALVGLRRRQSGAEGEVARLRAELADREAETVQRLAALEADSVRREEYWRDEVTERLTRQAERVRAETEHLVEERLPAALARTEIPAPPDRPDSGDLPDPSVTEWFDRLLTEVSGAVAHREESQRLALVELASRVQTSAHRIQAAVTGLADRHPGDSELLETTMRVDHAATQQARHAQSLKVLCGEWPGQQWQKPLAMVDVVRAASGRIVAFKRIEVTGDPNVGVAPSVVEPLIHLLAELLANATEYSPPRTGVPVTVRTVQRGAVIEVDDGGLGMDEYR